jgi:hypothetical protein
MSKKNKVTIKREYDICRCLITNIQSITGHKTHDIIAFMDGLAQQCLKDNGLDFASAPKKNNYGDYDDRYISVQNYGYYPDTKVYLGVSISREAVYSRSYEESYILVKYRFYTPSTFKKLNEKDFDEMVIDAMLTDTSLDFDPPNIRKNKTLIQKEQEEKEREERETKREIKANLKELKELLSKGLELDNTKKAGGGNWLKRDLNMAIARNAREIQHTISYLKELGDKTHESLFPSTDSIF